MRLHVKGTITQLDRLVTILATSGIDRAQLEAALSKPGKVSVIPVMRHEDISSCTPQVFNVDVVLELPYGDPE